MHRSCRRCGERQGPFSSSRAQLCDDCKLHGRDNGITCFECGQRRPVEQFPYGDGSHRRPETKSGRRPRRHRRRCHDCLAKLEEEKRLQRIERSATWKNYRGVVVRRCSSCKTVHPLDETHFHVAHPALPRDRSEYFAYRCKKCANERVAAYNRDKRLQGDPDFLRRRREAQRAWTARNPAKAKAASARYRQRRRDGLVVPLAERRTHDPTHPRIPRPPFLEWIERTLPLYPTEQDFCDLIGISTRTLLRLRTDGGKLVEFDTVDKALVREGGEQKIDDLYGAFFEAAA